MMSSSAPRKVIIPKSLKGLRLDKALAILFREKYTRSFLRKLFAERRISSKRRVLKPSSRLKNGEEIEIDFPPQKMALKPYPQDIAIVYEDDFLLIINKPSGLLTHPTLREKSHTLVNMLLSYTSCLSQKNSERAGIVHRLDKDTSGLILIAKDDRVHSLLTRAFSKREIKKTYLAIVEGKFARKEGRISLPLKRSEREPTKMKIGFLKSKPAFTEYKVLMERDFFSLVLLRPITGRRHQLRVHLRFLGHPILGDEKYSSRKGYSRMFLHAWRLEFNHPCIDKYMDVKAPLPQDFLSFLGLEAEREIEALALI